MSDQENAKASPTNPQDEAEQGGLAKPDKAKQHKDTKPITVDLDVADAVIALQNILRFHMVKLEFIKVDRLPIIQGAEVTHIAGIPLRTHIYEDEADYWRYSKDPNDETSDGLLGNNSSNGKDFTL